MTNAISYGNYDDAFDWQDGWQGQNNTNWYVYQENKGNFGIEIEASSNNNDFWPKFTNITLKELQDVLRGCRRRSVDAIQFKKTWNGDLIML